MRAAVVVIDPADCLRQVVMVMVEANLLKQALMLADMTVLDSADHLRWLKQTLVEANLLKQALLMLVVVFVVDPADHLPNLEQLLIDPADHLQNLEKLLIVLVAAAVGLFVTGCLSLVAVQR